MKSSRWTTVALIALALSLMILVVACDDSSRKVLGADTLFVPTGGDGGNGEADDIDDGEADDIDDGEADDIDDEGEDDEDDEDDERLDWSRP